METVGSEPALRYEVTRTGQLPNFPADNGEAKPPNAPDGSEYVKISTPTQPHHVYGASCGNCAAPSVIMAPRLRGLAHDQ